MTRSDEDGLWLVQGEVTEPEAGRFMFQRQRTKGVAGAMVGFVHYHESETAYKVKPEGVDGAPLLVEVSVHEVICRGYRTGPVEEVAVEEPQHLPQTHPTDYPIPPGENNIIQLQSLPGSDAVVYLDFDGEERDFAMWGYINAAPSGANNNQIYDVWKGVSEDYQPFNINVTTIRGVYDAAPEGQRMHVVITPTTNAAPGAGGVAYLDSFNWDGEMVCWSFYSVGKDAVEVISHEIGHTLTLRHHGRINPAEEYYLGHPGWAPIMGAGYFQPVTHWSKGEYPSANRSSQDDLMMISTRNNAVAYRVDDHGNDLAGSSFLEISAGGGVSNEGIIERSTDFDVFRFSTNGGAVNLNFGNVNFNPNLDIRAEMLDSSGAVLFSSSPENLTTASFQNRTLAAGTYYVRVSGSGKGTLATGYSDYGSLGGYTITGTVSGGVHSDRFSIAENSPNGSLVGTVAARANHGAGTLSYAISSGNTGGAFAIDPATGVVTVANSSMLDYESLATRWDEPANFVLFVSVTDSQSVASESIRTVIRVLDVNEPPVITPMAALRIPENLALGTELTTISAVDPDHYDFVTFSIAGGNPGNAFTISSAGVLSVSGALDFESRPSYSLVIRARDQLTPVSESTITLEINLVDTVEGYAPGSIIRTVYNGIPGASVEDLTSHFSFPNNYSAKEELASFDGGLNRGDRYGSTIRGYLIAPATGDYTFWIASDNSSELWISTDESLDNVVLRASLSGLTDRYNWTANASQESVSIPLVEGRAYYIEARHKEDVGADHVAVAWQGPGIGREVIPGTWLSPFDPEGLPKVVISNPVDEFVEIPAGVGMMLECVATGPNGVIPTVLWSQIEGPVTAVFESPNAKKTAVSLPVTGVYRLRVTASDGVNTVFDEVIIRSGASLGMGLVHTRYGAATTGNFTITGAPGYTITGASIGIPLVDYDDGFQLLGQVFQGDFDLITRVVSGANVASNHERMGLIVRQGTEPVSNGISAYIGYRTSTSWGHFIRRPGLGAANQQNSYENTGLPGWCRIKREGRTVRTYHSYNQGQTWISRGSINITGPVRAGLCWSSSNKSQTGWASFDNVQGFAPSNLAPSVNAGADASTPVSIPYTLNGSASDDGLPVAGGGVTTLWERISGPGEITFGNAEELDSTVTCDTSGTHVLRLTAYDGGVATYDEMLLTVLAPNNQPPAFSGTLLVGAPAAAGASYTGFTLASEASDPDAGDVLTFTKTSGPAWLSVAPDGQLSGVPGLGDGGLNSFVVRVTDSENFFAETTLEITVTLTPWQDWLVDEFGEDAEDPLIAGDLVDGDNDSYVNLMEYALGMKPMVADVPAIFHDMVDIGGASFLRLTIHRNPAATDLSFAVQVASDPGDPASWNTTDTHVEEDSPALLKVRDTVGGAKRFIRLGVSRNP
jgi:hypothetical protein